MITWSKGFFVVCGLLLTGATAVAQDAADAPDEPTRRALTLADRVAIRNVGNPRISPDGKLVAFELGDQVHVVGASGAPARPVSSPGKKASSPRWSADGRFLYFLSDRSGSSQVWKLPVDGFGEALPVTDLPHGVSSLELSPDATRLLLVFRDDDLRDEKEKKTPEPFVITRRQFKQDEGEGYITAGQIRHVYVHDIASKMLSRISSGAFIESEPVWSPNGESVVFITNREPDAESSYRTDVWLASADPGAPVLRRLTNGPLTRHSPAFSPDGKAVAYIAAEDGVYGLQHLAIVALVGGEPTILTAALDRWVDAFQFDPQGQWIYIQYHDAGAVRLARVRIRDARIETLTADGTVVRGFHAGNGGQVVVRMNHADDLPDLYLHGSKMRRLTDLNQSFLASRDAGAKQTVTVRGPDGTEVQYFLTTPPGHVAGQQHPAVLKIHGGPVGQFEYGYDFETQFLAANGYVVIEPNPRGSTGHGQDYIRGIYQSWGITDYDDVMATVDDAIERGIANPERLAVTGFSYGGYMTNVLITRSQRFKAAASGAGHSLIAANFGHDIYQQWYVWEMGMPWANRDLYDSLSPLLRADQVQTPTIFLGGRIDWNVPVLNAELFYQALRVRGIDTELVVYPKSHHGGWSTEFENDYLHRIVTWFDRYLKNNDEGAEPGDG